MEESEFDDLVPMVGTLVRARLAGKLADKRERRMSRKAVLELWNGRSGRALTAEELERQVDINIVCAIFMDNGASDADALADASLFVLGPLLIREAAPGEGMLASGLVQYVIVNQHAEPAFLAVTEQRVLWTMVMTMAPVWSMWFADVCEATQLDDRWVRIVARPKDYPVALRGVNPQGEIEGVFGFREGFPDGSLGATLLRQATQRLSA